MRVAAVACAVLLLAGCPRGGSLPSVDRALTGVDQITPDNFTYCSDHGCKVQQAVKLTDADWASITEPLAMPAADAAAERQAVIEAVGRYETTVARQTGTAVDRGGTSVFPGPRQLDCVDESVNTTRFLTLLEKAGLLHFHQRGQPAHRFMSGGLTHMTATLRELDGGQSWAVDSWFRDSGEMADVIELEAWQAGWRPAGY